MFYDIHLKRNVLLEWLHKNIFSLKQELMWQPDEQTPRQSQPWRRVPKHLSDCRLTWQNTDRERQITKLPQRLDPCTKDKAVTMEISEVSLICEPLSTTYTLNSRLQWWIIHLFCGYTVCLRWKLPRGGQLIIMAEMEWKEWYQTHENKNKKGAWYHSIVSIPAIHLSRPPLSSLHCCKHIHKCLIFSQTSFMSTLEHHHHLKHTHTHTQICTLIVPMS
jgi:hypothetical protein